MKNQEISVKKFYSNATKKEYYRDLQKRKNKKNKLEGREADYKERPLTTGKPYNTCFSEYRVWKWFPRQQPALDFTTLDQHQTPLCVFAQEKCDGKRRYLVTTRKQFWDRYKTMETSTRHFYEVVRLSDPCRLYFDIEFQREFNPAIEDESMLMQTFILYISYCVYREFGLVCERKDVVDLSSSTTTKFSRHLIFHLGNALFFNNIHCGEFVREVCRCLKDYLETGSGNKFLPVILPTTEGNRSASMEEKENLPAAVAAAAATTTTTSTLTATLPTSIRDQWIEELTTERLNGIIVRTETGKTFLCDLAVYTKNRNFRLYLSSKVSKYVPLEISNDNKFCFKRKISRREKYFHYQMKNLVFDPEYERFADTLLCPEPKKPDLLTYDGGRSDGIKVKKFLYPKDDMESTEDALRTGTQASNFPELDKFVISQVNKFGSKGMIRRWIHFKSRDIMIYDIGDNRWCANIQREHKSNHIYYVADLKFNIVYQKCHDPDCGRYRSPEISIPRGLNPLNKMEEPIEDFDVSYDEELNQLFEADFPWDDSLSQVEHPDTGYVTLNDGQLNSIETQPVSNIVNRPTSSRSELNNSAKHGDGSFNDGTDNSIKLVNHPSIDLSDLPDSLFMDEEISELGLVKSNHCTIVENLGSSLVERPNTMVEKAERKISQSSHDHSITSRENSPHYESTSTSKKDSLKQKSTSTLEEDSPHFLHLSKEDPLEAPHPDSYIFVDDDISGYSSIDEIQLYSDNEDDSHLLEQESCQDTSIILFEGRGPVVETSKARNSKNSRNGKMLVELLEDDLDDEAFLEL